MSDIRRNLSEEELRDIKILLVGDNEKAFSEAWIKQGFCFKDFPPYGIMQKEVGPGGVIAAVQAFILYELLYGNLRIELNKGFLRPTYQEKIRALSSAITRILLQASGRDNAVLVLKFDDQLQMISFSSQDQLYEDVCRYVQLFMNDGGVILFLYSIILTRGIDRIKEDMDFPEKCLIEDSKDSQELINLILVGKAVQNMFNGSRNLDHGIVLEGIQKKSTIGFLSSFDDYVPVGNFYKNPEYPIWVLNAYSRYYVLFGTTEEILETDEAFELMYVDSLSTDPEIRFTVNPKSIRNKDLRNIISCIYTKWPSASVEAVVKYKEEDFLSHDEKEMKIKNIISCLHTKWPSAIVEVDEKDK